MTRTHRTAQQLRALVVVGSPAVESHTGALAEAIDEALRMRGFTTDVVNLATTGFPHVDLQHYYAEAPHPVAAVRAFIETARAADAVALVTPVQHASYSGLLKSAIDLLPPDAFEHTPVAVAAHAGGIKGSTSACEHLRTVVKALGGWAVPSQVSSAAADFDDSSGRLVVTNASVLRRCGAIADECALFAGTLRAQARADLAEGRSA